jgi:hypothetical protein
MTEVRPLGSTGITPLPGYYGPLRLPTVHAGRVIDSSSALSLRRNPFASGITSDLPGSLADLSTRALPYHPEQSDGFKCPLIPHQWQASPYPGGWPLLFGLNEAETGSLALGSRLRRQGGHPPFRPKAYGPWDQPTTHAKLPGHGRLRLHTERTISMPDSFQSGRFSQA